MTIAEIIAALPADKQAAAKAELDKLDGAVKIDSRDVADKLLREHPYLKAANDAEVSRAVAAHDTKFQAEKLPSLVEEEIKKRGPKPKDPELAAALDRVAKLEESEAKAKAQAIEAEQKSLAVKLLSGIGLPAKMAGLFIGQNDEETQAKFSAYFDPKAADSFLGWRDAHLTKELQARFGNQPMPPAGAAPAPQDLEAQFKKAMADGNADLALVLQGKLQAAAMAKR